MKKNFFKLKTEGNEKKNKKIKLNISSKGLPPVNTTYSNIINHKKNVKFSSFLKKLSPKKKQNIFHKMHFHIPK